MEINKFLDSTYLKTTEQAKITAQETKQNVIDLVNEAIKYHFVLVMIRPKFVALAKKMIIDAKSNVNVGTVIGFHKGINTIENKLIEAQKAIDNKADDLDYVINYEAFKKGDVALVKNEVLKGTKIGLDNNKIVKWIIEIAALNDQQIIEITKLIRDIVVQNFNEEQYKKVFVKSSTGFYNTQNAKPTGATLEAMQLIVKNAKPLSSKAAGGVKNYDDAIKMVNLGVTRIGTSTALKIFQGK
ncbi:MAG: deoxyribose-phosphate aldolase [Flavobacteriaceae bacterium]|nr:deoxyribose-phosphate aldolase [Flavobacteriaceae bacterium]